MKKFSILALCALTAMGAMAQANVIKDAEKAMKSKKGFNEVVKIMKPAFNDPSTSNLAETFYIPGKAGIDEYDDALGKVQFGMIKNTDTVPLTNMYNALVNGYSYLLKALPLDTVVDAKGKVKTKYSKDIISKLGGHHTDLWNAGAFLNSVKDYEQSYEAFKLYVTTPDNPAIKKALSKEAPDSTRALLAFNMGILSNIMNKNEQAIDAYMLAEKLGFREKSLYDYAISTASQLGDQDLVEKIANMAMPLYGKEDPNYIALVIDGYIKNGKYQEALPLIDNAIAAQPDNSQYYVIKGILLEQDGMNGDSKALYEKAVEVDPYNKMANYNLGRKLYSDAIEIYNNAPDDQAEFSKIFVTEFKPVMLKAVEYLENAYNLDDQYTDPLKLLQDAYNLLRDEKNLNYTIERLNQ